MLPNFERYYKVKHLKLYTKINSKCSKDLNVKSVIIKLLEENIGENLHNTGLGGDFLATTPKEQSIQAKSDKWEYIKTKSFFTAKESINKMKRQHKEYEKHLQTMYLIIINIQNIKELLQLTNKTKNK